jgi:hypothetical protein
MAPPKELAVDERGELYLKSFDGFLELITETAVMSELMPIHCLFDNPYAAVEKSDDRIWLSNESVFEAFLLDGSYRDSF